MRVRGGEVVEEVLTPGEPIVAQGAELRPGDLRMDAAA
jgi:hypothetical protein